MIEGSESYNVGFFDSGTTFVYLPETLFQYIEYAFEVFCNGADTEVGSL
jgi:hypothetical protein